MHKERPEESEHSSSAQTKIKNLGFASFRVITQKHRAGDEARTRDLQLGRLSLYQLSYSRIHIATFFFNGFSKKQVGRVGFEPT